MSYSLVPLGMAGPLPVNGLDRVAGRSLERALADVARAGLLRRAHDRMLADLASARISDVEAVAKRRLESAAEIALEADYQIRRAPGVGGRRAHGHGP